MRRYKLQIRGRDFVVDVDELSADDFIVQVGDQSYEVSLTDEQDLSLAAITPQMAPTDASPAAAPNPAADTRAAPGVPAARAPAPAAARGPSGANVLKAPMPGVVLEVSVTAGTRVDRGQQIAVLEAMKMQNTIRSPRAGLIAEVYAVAGQSVGHGEALVRFESA